MKYFKISVIGKTRYETEDLEKLSRDIPYSRQKTLNEIKLDLKNLFPELITTPLDFKVVKIVSKYEIKPINSTKIKYKNVEIRKIVKEFDDPLNNYIGDWNEKVHYRMRWELVF